MKIFVMYSGGKDSQACLIWAVKKYGAGGLKAVFCDTGWESPVTYRHITETCKDLGVELVTLKSKKYDGMIGLATKKQRFPSVKARFCTEELKSKPVIDYLLDEVGTHFMSIQGIRSGESAARSKMKDQCRMFKYYFEPYGYDKKDKPRYHTYRKKDIKAFCEKYTDDIWRPVFDWTGNEVMNYIIENGQKPNPLYYQGFKRVGCFPCIMCSHAEMWQLLQSYPERFEEVINYENEVGSSYFKIDAVPERYKSGTNSTKKYARATDIKRYLKDKHATLDMFEQEEEAPSCSSFYNICE